ncbi:mercuric reductase [Flavobacteriaceae bacterium TP-CH-4]|uniref:Mercuric reductase n=1 Tax=Pelagihabitans pacificus TaxID=2696054 RepID=A0A967E9G2_9FLAO|nr:mercuric reductase [Pelagihabitans pacificus]NHF58441.1 mercuric reductase [Pelagihabitans pacificus]
MKTYDHIILGTGQATGTLLGRLISTGDSIAVIEKNKVGGSCVNYGCTPTKALVASARAIHMARRGSEFGFKSSDVEVDFPAIRSRMNKIRNDSSTGLRNWIENTENVDFYQVQGEFVSDKTLQVGKEQIRGEHIYINVGTRPRVPEIAGIDEVFWMDSARLLEKLELPKHLIIIGGGYIGVEFSQVYRRFGCEVTIVQRGGQLMPREDEDVADGIDKILTDEGIKILYNAEAVSVSEGVDGIELVVEKDGDRQAIAGSDLLLAVGRIPNSDTIGLEHTSIETDERGYIQVDDFCSTGVEGVYALGDVNGEGAFTHTSVNDAEIVLDKLFGGTRTISQRIPIYGLFTDPPLGRVGMSEKEALKSGKKVLKSTHPHSKISRAKEMSETKGFTKLLVDGETDLILGASILGVNGDEIINMFAAIMHSGIECRNYREVVLVHPTISELMPWILDGIKEAQSQN